VSGSSQNYTPKNGFLEFGSTSIKFYLVALSGEKAGEVEKEIKIPWELGFEVFQGQRISPSSISFCLKTLSELSEQFPDISFEGVTAIGTSALREAQNVEIFRRLLREHLGLKLGIIEGGFEAFLLETGFKASVTDYPTGLFDLGGGSLELVEYLNPHSSRKTSLPIGAIRLHCRLRRHRDVLEYIRAGRQLVLDTFDELLDDRDLKFHELIGTGGTVKALAASVGRDEFGLEDIQALIQREIHGEPLGDLLPYRRRVFLPGLLVVESLYSALKIRCIRYRPASVKGGLISLAQLIPPR
jgi:exopolyphosphatase/pppGpp-phosphohydrolase